MENIIFQDSPLAEYLEGQGIAEHEWASIKTGIEPLSPEDTAFAPRGLPIPYSKIRRKLHIEPKLEAPYSKGIVARLHEELSSGLNSRLGRRDNAQFLEQFRYTIVASQLLNDHVNAFRYGSLGAPNASQRRNSGATEDYREEENIKFSWLAICSILGGAFAVAWSIHWIRRLTRILLTGWVLFAEMNMVGLVALTLYAYFRRQSLKYLRRQAVETASSLVSNAQSLDAAYFAAINLVQEVELVSRGYKISNPLPPISRLEEQGHIRRCIRLRKTMRSALASTLTPYVEAYKTLRPSAVDLDFEKYCDIYEISQTDVDGITEILANNTANAEDGESLKSLKVDLAKLHLVRRFCLCVLLALDADGGKRDFALWSSAIDFMQRISSITAKSAISLDDLLSEDRRFSTPPTPKHLPRSPEHERMRAQMRKLTSLSSGIRGLQAKMHILREESDQTLDESSDVSELGPHLVAQYESIGEDLKSLLQEWKNGKVALAGNIDRNERRISLCSSAGGLTSDLSHSSTPSLDDLPEGGQAEALRILNGEISPRGIGVPDLMGTSSDEEVFEAVALPKQRSMLSREERIAKMKEERMRQAVMRESRDASTNMLRELETVIKLRPQKKERGLKGRIMSV